MAKREFKLLCLFDYNCATGFATVSHNIIDRFVKHFGPRLIMDIVAINYIDHDAEGKPIAGKPYYMDQYKRMAVHPAIAEKSNAIDLLGRHEFLRLLRTHDYDIVFIIQDPGVMAGQVDESGVNTGNVWEEMKLIKYQKKTENRRQFKTVFYFPIDGVPLNEWFNDFDIIDVPVAYTEYARAEVYKVKPQLKGKLKYVLHGINLKDFYPMPEISEFRNQYFGENSKKEIWGNINRNQTRKDIPSTIFSFENYLHKYNENAFLYLHMSPIDPQGWNLHTVLKQTSLIEGTHYMFQKKEARDTSKEELNKIYNSLDFYITTTTGEGMGLGLLESMACKIPVIAPYHTSIIDISGGIDERCMCISDLKPYVSHFDNMVRKAVYVDLVPDDMHDMAIGARQTIMRTDKAREFAQSLSWENICKFWIEEFEKLL